MNINQTLKNMESVVGKLETEIYNEHFQAAKTLTNTYKNLLGLLNSFVGHATEELLYKKELIEQEKKVTLLYEKANSKINEMLNNENYKSADNLTLIVERLLKSKSDLKWLLGAEGRYKNLYQYNKKDEKPKLKNVAVIGASVESAKAKYEELREQFLSVIKVERENAISISFDTDELVVEAVRYSESHRGKRLDEIYVDKNLKISDLHLIQTMKKEKDTPIHYF